MRLNSPLTMPLLKRGSVDSPGSSRSFSHQKSLARAHFLFFQRLAAVRVVIEQGFRLRHVHAVEEFVVAFRGHPVAVRGLVLAHQDEGLVLVAPVLEPVERLVGDDVADVAVEAFRGAIHLDEVRVVITSLAGEDFPVVESGGVADQVPLADDGGLVAGLLEVFGKGRLRAVEFGAVVIDEAVDVRVLAGEDAGARRAADRVGAIRTLENRALLGEAVDVRGGRDVLEAAAVGRDGLQRVVVGKQENDVGAFRSEGGKGCNEEQGRNAHVSVTCLAAWFFQAPIGCQTVLASVKSRMA